MNPSRTLGALYLTTMVSWSLGFGLIQHGQVALGGLFELVDAGAVLAMIAVTVPLMWRFSETLAVWYLVFRVIEAMLLVVALLCALVMVGDTALSVLCAELRGHWVQLLLSFFYSAAKIPFFYFLWQTRLVPRPIATLGLVGATLVLTSLPLDFFEMELGMVFGAIMGLTELFLGFWLLIRGFSGATSCSA